VSIFRRREARGRSAGEVRSAYNETHARSLLRDSDRFYRLMAQAVARFVLSPARRDSRAHGPARARVLDVGCGGGFLLRELSALAPRLSLHGVEISDVALHEARRQAPAARLVLAQGERLPYGEGCFDAVLCLGNLEHFLDPEAGARELARVSREDGAVWVLLPNGFYSGALWRVLTRGYGPDHHQVIERFASINEWRDLLEENGLAVEAIHPYNRFKWWKRLLPRNLAWHFLYRARKRGPRSAPSA
jgi:SAM-dependent methyltransferase